MPSIHAILLLALSAVGAADAPDEQYQDRPLADDPFAAPADYRSNAPRQPLAAANGTAPVAVQLPPSPLPIDDDQQPQATPLAGPPEPNSYAPDQGSYTQDTGLYAPETVYAAPAQWTGPANDVGPGGVAPAVAEYPSAAPPTPLHEPVRPIPLSPPAGAADLVPRFMPTVPWPMVVGSLSGVIGLFFALVWTLRRGGPRAGGVLPREVVEVLGRLPLADRKQMQLLRLGNKLVLIAVSQTGTDMLAEVTDPVEVDRLTGLCYQRHPHSSTVAFHKVFKSLETAPRRKGARGAAPVSFADLERLGFDDSDAESDHVH